MKKMSWVMHSLVVCVLFSFTTAFAQNNERLAIVGATVYTRPDSKPLTNGVVLIQDGKITSVGTGKRVPKNFTIIDGKGLTVVAGFWNSHVHLTAPELAAERPAAQLSEYLQAMFTKYGFTTVFDIGSVPANTIALRKRLEAGEIAGPKILTTCGTIFPKDGIPFYLQPIAEQMNLKAAEAGTTSQAEAMVKTSLDIGGDGIKIFSASPTRISKVVVMPLEIVKAVTTAAHQRGKPVFAHPQSKAGIDVAIDGGVNVLAHTTPDVGDWSAELISRMKRAHMALMPTLTLWNVGLIQEGATPEVAKRFQEQGVKQLRAFAAAGGEVIFGTDVGYIQKFDTTEEYEQMQKAGMSFQQILTALTTAPATRFKVAGQCGRIEIGCDADLVILAGDPAADIRALAKVRYTLRKGKVIYQSK